MSFVKEVQEWDEQKLPKVLPGYGGGRLPGRSTKERGRGEEEAEEERRQRHVRNEIVQEVVPDIEKKERAQADDRPISQRTIRQSVKQSWNCSQIENEGREEDDWRKRNGLKMKSWKRFWNNEERKELPCRQKSCRRCLSG